VTADDVAASVRSPGNAAVPVSSPGCRSPPLPIPASALPEPLAELVPERARLAANLLESLRHGTAVEDDAALRDFDVRPVGLGEAVAAALV
jgi:hypothetical protein